MKADNNGFYNRGRFDGHAHQKHNKHERVNSQNANDPRGGKPPKPSSNDSGGNVSDFPGRDGYDPNFLGTPLPMPQLDDSIKDRPAPLLADPSKNELKYTHFSIIQDKERRTPLVTAVNIDGATAQDLERKGSWVLDNRIDTKYQMGNEAYSNNNIDKGHQVRRRDPMWGPDAEKAGGDTFVYTNASLQHANLNQRPWLDMENYVLDGAIAHQQKKCVFTGPVLRDDDPGFNNHGKMKPTKMPCAFWKVEAWNEPGKGIQGEAFLMSQKDIMGGANSKADWIHLTPMQLQTYRIPMAQLEEITHLHFGNIQDVADPDGSLGGSPRPAGGGGE